MCVCVCACVRVCVLTSYTGTSLLQAMCAAMAMMAAVIPLPHVATRGSSMFIPAVSNTVRG